MRKRLFICTIFVLLSCFHYAAAEMNSNMYVMIGNVAATEPQLEIVIADTGKHYEHGERNHILSATITAIDGSFFQQLFYNTLESPLSAPELRFARLTDVNFDGFLDLNLLVAAGAEYIYTSIALWNVEAGQFDPVMTLRSGLTDETILKMIALPCAPPGVLANRKFFLSMTNGLMLLSARLLLISSLPSSRYAVRYGHCSSR